MLKELMANIMNTDMLRRETNVEQTKILRWDDSSKWGRSSFL